MVWALKEPGGFGDFWPDGTFRKWREHIESYFSEQMSDGQRAGYNNRHVTYCYNISERFTKDLGPILPHEVPVEFETERSYLSLASTIKTENQLIAVDENLKNLIEEFEPDVHQFWPIRILMPKDKAYPQQYYGLRIGQFIESFIPVEGTHRADDSAGGPYLANGYDKAAYMKLQFSGERIGNAHLWREPQLLRPNIFISDSLQAAILERGLRIFKHYQVKVV
jgi:hypothetical protein